MLLYPSGMNKQDSLLLFLPTYLLSVVLFYAAVGLFGWCSPLEWYKRRPMSDGLTLCMLRGTGGRKESSQLGGAHLSRCSLALKRITAWKDALRKRTLRERNSINSAVLAIVYFVWECCVPKGGRQRLAKLRLAEWKRWFGGVIQF